MTPRPSARPCPRGGPADLVLVEGNRGLFDGLDAAGTHSTAELAKLVRAPVVLVVDVTKTTRTVAAMVLGCQALDRDVRLAGVVLNRVATARQERVIRDAVRAAGGPPVLGAIPRLDHDPFPGRHLGLVTAAEHPGREQALASRRRARGAARRPGRAPRARALRAGGGVPRPRAGRGRPSRPGSACSATRPSASTTPRTSRPSRRPAPLLTFVSPLAAEALPEVDAVYVGGGFPEVHAERLAGNPPSGGPCGRRSSAGLPVYAECGGLMYLAKELRRRRRLPPDGGGPRPDDRADAAARGATATSRARWRRANPFFERGTTLRGHEFHYSRVVRGRDRSASRAPASSAGRGSATGATASSSAPSGRRTCTSTPSGPRPGPRPWWRWRGRTGRGARARRRRGERGSSWIARWKRRGRWKGRNASRSSSGGPRSAGLGRRPVQPRPRPHPERALIDRAEKAYRRALELDPDLVEAWVNLGGVLLLKWDFHGCLEANPRRSGGRTTFSSPTTTSARPTSTWATPRARSLQSAGSWSSTRRTPPRTTSWRSACWPSARSRRRAECAQHRDGLGHQPRPEFLAVSTAPSRRSRRRQHGRPPKPGARGRTRRNPECRRSRTVRSRSRSTRTASCPSRRSGTRRSRPRWARRKASRA